MKKPNPASSREKKLNTTSGVTLQQRPLKDGRVSLYLHIHQKNQKPERVWLKLYLIGDKFKDGRALAIADEARKQKHLELQMTEQASTKTFWRSCFIAPHFGEIQSPITTPYGT